MKIDKELDSKLRKLLTKIERPLTYAQGSNILQDDRGSHIIYEESIEALQLREEIIAMLNSSSQREGKYRQIDIEEAIDREKKNFKSY